MKQITLRAVQKLLRAVDYGLTTQLDQRQNRAENYNVFRVLGVEEKEVSLHSAFLVHLLNPFGTHGQGTLFLDCFLAQIGMKGLAKDAGWGCEKEWITPNGHIDILLQSKRNQIIIAIENKIYALDEMTQLRRYRDWLDAPHRERSFPMHSHRRLLYLTLKGEASKQSSAQGVEYTCISYRKHIIGFSRHALRNKIRAVHVKKSVEQYINTLQLLAEGTLMEDASDRQVVNLALQRNNRRAALAMTRCAPMIEDQLLRAFWQKGERFLGQQLKKHRSNTGCSRFQKMSRRRTAHTTSTSCHVKPRTDLG